LLSPVAFQSKGRWLNHVDVRKPHFVRRWLESCRVIGFCSV
jgi:hypothetical protein